MNHLERYICLFYSRSSGVVRSAGVLKPSTASSTKILFPKCNT